MWAVLLAVTQMDSLPCVLLIMEPVTLAPSRITSSRLWVFVGCVLIHVLSAVTMVTCDFTSMMLFRPELLEW